MALLGCGTVGREVLRLLTEQADELAARVGAPVQLVGVAVRRPRRHSEVPAELLTTDAAELVSRDGVDIVIEVIGGIDPARSLLLDALRADGFTEDELRAIAWENWRRVLEKAWSG